MPTKTSPLHTAAWHSKTSRATVTFQYKTIMKKECDKICSKLTQSCYILYPGKEGLNFGEDGHNVFFAVTSQGSLVECS